MFGVPALDFLGYRLDANGIRPLEQKVQVIRDFPLPTSQRKLREFLGLVNFYRRFIPHCAATLKPITDLLKGGSCTRQILSPGRTQPLLPSTTTSNTLLLMPHYWFTQLQMPLPV